MNYKIKHAFYLTDPEALLSESYYRRLWLAVRNVDIPRRSWLEELADLMRDYDGTIYQDDGTVYEFPLIDDIFGDDFDMRWMGYYLLADDSGHGPRMKSRKIERLQLLDLYMQIKYPDIAKHFKD